MLLMAWRPSQRNFPIASDCRSMALSKRLLSQIFLGIGHAVERGDAQTLDEIHRILKDKRPSSSPVRKVVGKSGFLEKNSAVLIEHESASEFREKFLKFESREELSEFITLNYPRKADIISIGRELKIPVTKNDDYEALVDRIIDATIGYKLRSRAIRGDG